jgi:hypothetical protein
VKAVDCVCVNLDSATARREEIEANFDKYKGPGWTWTRFPAVTPADPRVAALGGSVAPTEKACFLSHKLALESRLGTSNPVFVLEDDAMLGPRSAAFIDRIVFANDALNWDILYTDICVPLPGPMIDLANLRRTLAQPEVRLMNLRGYTYAGATAYIVNPRSLARLHGLLDGLTRLDRAYDLELRYFVNANQLNAFAFFPFLTTVSSAADSSQVQADQSPDAVWNLFRRLMWMDRDVGSQRGAVDRLEQDVDGEEARALGRVLLAAGRFSRSK